MFRLDPHPTFAAPVAIKPLGGGDAATLQITFRHKGVREFEAWRLGPADLAAKGQPLPSDAQWLAEIIDGWGDVVLGADGAVVPFGVAALDSLLNSYPGAAVAIFDAYLQAFEDARKKN